MKLPPLILASASPRRKLLLKQISLRFAVKPSFAAEKFLSTETPAVNVKRIALEKAQSVRRSVKRGIVVAADTIVVLNGKILGKPKSLVEAKRMLRLLSGREHVVYTGFALIDARTGESIAGVEQTKVRFRKLDKDEIGRYVSSSSPMDKAGAYGIQDDYGAVFVEKVNGCFYNVMGFPLSRFYVVLQKFVKTLEKSKN